MAELQIKTGSLPQRCEICHKVDCFDPKTNYCSRCANAKVVEPVRIEDKPEPTSFIVNPALILSACYVLFYGGYGLVRIYTDSIVPFRHRSLMNIWQVFPVIEIAFFILGIVSLRQIRLFYKQNANRRRSIH